MDWLEKYPSRSPGTAFRFVNGEALIVVPHTGRVYALNQVGSFIWHQADGTRTGSDIVQGICQRFEVTAQEAAGDLPEFFQDLVVKGLLEIVAQPVAAGR